MALRPLEFLVLKVPMWASRCSLGELSKSSPSGRAGFLVSLCSWFMLKSYGQAFAMRPALHSLKCTISLVIRITHFKGILF